MLFPKKTFQVTKTYKKPLPLKDRKPEDAQF